MNTNIDLTSTCLETEYLILGSWREDDFWAYISIEEVGEVAGWSKDNCHVIGLIELKLCRAEWDDSFKGMRNGLCSQ